MKNKKDKIIVFLFLGYIGLFMVLNIIIPDKKISHTERRTLASFPTFEISSKYITDLEDYLLDHFPFRDKFRSIKASFNYNILKKLDNNDIYLKDNYIFKSNYPTNRKSINNFINNIMKINAYLKDTNNVYLMAIPDKNYYLEEKYFLHIDYDYIYKELEKTNINLIDIRNIMNIKDYYETDTHWKQENLLKVVKKLSEEMSFEYQELSYTKYVYDKFYGVYYGESAVNRKTEILTYLTNGILENVEVSYLENRQLKSVYNINKLNGLDAYEVYLDGASALINIENKNSINDKELIIFRDSFGSSLTPLLIPYYSKITIIDNRYINSNNFLKYVDFKDQDVLFMYSTLMINNSFSLKS